MQKMCTKSWCQAFSNFGKSPKTAIACKKLSKSLKRVGLFFLLNAIFFNGQDYEKEKGSRTSDQLPFLLQTNSENSFISDELPDQV